MNAPPWLSRIDALRDGPITAGALLALGSVLAFAPDAFLAMLARAFLWQWAIAFVLLTLIALFTRRWWSAMACCISAGLVAAPISATTEPATAGVELLSVAQMNLLQPNEEHQAVVRTALNANVDLISFQEVSPLWERFLVEGLSTRFPYHCIVPGTDCYGIALFSRFPFEEQRVLSLGSKHAIDAVLRTDHGPVRVLTVHATSPGSYGEYKERNAQLLMLAKLVRSTELPTVVLGDLNTVSWDAAFEGLCIGSGLHERRSAVTATWPVLFGHALIPLDHVLVSPGVAVSSLRSFPISGSDHRGIVARIGRAG